MLMAENRRDRDKRLFFTRVQLVLLGGAFTLASAIIFFLGMIVGKGIEARKIIKTEEPLVKIPVKPSTQESGATPEAQAKEEITFYDTLTKTPSEPAAQEKPKESKSPENTTKMEVKASKPAAKEEPPPTPSKAVAKEVEKAASPAETPTPTKTETAANKVNDGSWTVQVNAYPDERSAKLLVDQLKNKGYNAKVTEVLNKGKTWYRVRVGRYDSKEEAKKVEEVLKNNENFSKAFTTSR
jgi:cell division protein FtsN